MATRAPERSDASPYLPDFISRNLRAVRSYAVGGVIGFDPPPPPPPPPQVGMYPPGFNPYAAPVNLRGGEPIDVGGFVRGVGPYVSDIVGSAFDTLGTAAHSATEVPGQLVDAYRALLSGAPKAELEQKVSRAEGSAGTALLGGLSFVATPYTATSGAIIEKQVENDPNVADEFRTRIAELPENQQQRPTVRQYIAHEVVDSEVARLIRAVDEPNLTDDQKRAAFSSASLLVLERVAELGGPQIVSQVARFAPKAAQAIASRIPSRPVPRSSAVIGLEREAQFSGHRPVVRQAPQGVAETGLRSRLGMTPDQFADVGPAQQAAASDLAGQVQAAERRQLRRGVELSSRALPAVGARPGGITVAQGEELLRTLDAIGAPSDLRVRVEATVNAALGAQEAARAEGLITTQAERAAARSAFAESRTAASAAVNAEGRVGRTLSRAEEALALREAGLRGAEAQAAERVAQEQARQAARIQAEAEAAARIPQSLEERLAAMEQRLTDSFSAVTSAPTQVARALRAEAKRTRQKMATLPNRGLVGTREIQSDLMGNLGDVAQTEPQRAYGSGLARGRNVYSKTSDRLSLEAQADEYEQLAKSINRAQFDIRSAHRQLREAGRPYESASSEERALLRNSAGYRDFLGLDEATLNAKIDAADAAGQQASRRLRDLLQQAKDLGVRPHQVDEAQRLIEELRSDVTGIRGLMARAGERRASLPQAQLADAIRAEVSRGRAAIEDATLTSSEVRAGSRDAAGKIPAETGYAAPKDEAVLGEFGVNLGKWDSATTRQAMADAIRANPDKFRAAVDSMTYDEILSRVADKSGSTVDSLRAALPRRGELSARLLAADFALDKSAGDLVRAGQALAKKTITQAQFDEVYARHLDLQLAASEGTSETARALSAKKVRKVENAPFELLQADRRVKDAERAVTNTARDFEREVEAASRSEEAAADLMAKADEAKDSVAAAEVRSAATRSLEQARERVAQARAKVEAARAEHAAAVERAAEASDRAHAAYLRNAIVQGMSKEQVTVLAQMDPRDVAAVHNFIRLNKPLRNGEVLGTYLLNNTYGSVPSLEANFVNTGLHVLYQNLVVRPLSRVTGPLVGKAIGEAVVVPGETKAAWVGLYSAIPDATRLFMRTVLHGEDPEIALKYGLVGIDKESALKFGHAPRPVVRGPLGLPIEGVLRILGGSDGFWRVLDTSAESRALVVRDAYARGLRDGDVAKALAEWLDHPDQATLQRASAISLRTTFNDPVEVGSVTQRFLHFLNSDIDGFAPLRILIPAARFGISAMRHAVSLSGYGLVSGARSVAEARGLEGIARTEAGRRAAREFAEGALGAMLIITANQMWDAGLLTGANPDDPVERERWRKEGKQANAILIGGHWVPQSSFGPLAAPFVLTALLRDQLDQSSDKELSERVSRGARAIGSYLADMPAFQGTYQLLDTIFTGLKYGATAGVERFAALNLGRFIPESATLNSIVPVWDPYERDPDGLIQRIEGRLPGVSLTLPARVDRFGQPVPRKLSGPGALSPFQGTAEVALDPVDRELRSIGVSVGFVADRIADQRLTAEEQRLYQEIAGTRSYDAVERVLTSNEYRAADLATRQRLVNSAVNNEREAARNVVAEHILSAASDDAGVTRALKMLRSTLDMRSLAYKYTDLMRTGKLTPAVRAAMNDSRGYISGTRRMPTVEQMARDSQYVRQYLNTPPYRIGGPAEWRKLQDAKRDMNDYLKAHPRPVALTEVEWYARYNPTGAALIRRYSNRDVVNPERKRLLDAHPEILPYLEVTIRVPSTNITNP